MVSKKLTEKQKRRINQRKESISHNNMTGTIICHYGKFVDIENNLENIVRCHIRKNLPDLATGDKVAYELESDMPEATGVVTKLLPRQSLIARTNQYKASTKPVAANVDQLFIVFAPKPEPQSYLIDQFIIIAESSNVTPILIFNKSDLYNELSTKEQKECDILLKVYTDIGYDVLELSALYSKNMNKLSKKLENNTSIFVGQSGVGKSTLTQQFLKDTDIKTGAISEKTSLGKHTTSVSRLYHILDMPNTDLIDSPGIREMGVSHLSKEELEQAFIEFRPYLGKCKFRDCKHEKEPGCALKEALANQEICQMRFDNYKKFVS